MVTIETNPTHIWYTNITARHFGRLGSRPTVRITRPTGKRQPPVRYTDINHLWHTTKERPSVKGQLLIQTKDGRLALIRYAECDFCEMCKNKGWKRWAYIESFLPYK